MSVHELMIAFGFVFHRKCSCDGFVTEVWRNGNLEFRWRKFRYRYKMKEGGKTIKSWDSVANLENYLNELFESVDQQTGKA